MRTLDRPPSAAFHRFVAAAALALAGAFAWLFYIRYWEWRDCIAQSLSSCVTPDGDNLTTAGMFWGFPCLPLLAAAVFSLTRARRLRREAS